MSANVLPHRPQSFNLLMTADAVGGVWQYCTDLVWGLSQRGIAVTVATMGPRPRPQQRDAVASIPGARVIESDWALEWMQSAWTDVDRAGDWLLTLQAQYRFDLIHLNGFVHAGLPWSKPVVCVAHSCVYSWWRAVHNCSPGPEWATYESRVSAGLHASPRVVTPSVSMKKSIESEYGITSEKLRVVHNFTRVTRQNSKDKEPFVLAAGRFWDQAKNVALLGQVAPYVNWPIWLAGPTESPDDVNAADLDPIRLLGSLPHEDLIDHMRRAAIFAHPALYEPFGLSVLEAARAGCCLVLSNIPSMRELWEGAAVFVDARNPQEWVKVLNMLSRDSDALESLGRLACKRSGRYRLGSAVNAYCTLYRELISQSHSSSEAAA